MPAIYDALHLLEVNKEICKRINLKPYKSPDDIIDFLIALHMVLEISLNGLIREVVVENLQKTIDRSKIVDNLDRISFIDKTVMFLYMEHYDFGLDIDKADENHKIIGLIKSFSEARNKLMHGSMIGSFDDSLNSNDSVATRLLNSGYLEEQIKKFKDIVAGMTFYIDHLIQGNIDKTVLIVKFLDVHFLDTATS
jgi:hypothetical protein